MSMQFIPRCEAERDLRRHRPAVACAAAVGTVTAVALEILRRLAPKDKV